LAVDQKASASRQLFANGNQVAWTAEVPGSKARYVAVFNTGDSDTEKIRIQWPDLGLPVKSAVRDLWSHKDLGTVEGGQVFEVKPHASGFYRVTP
jgi:alpha-galactosidase